MNYSNEGGGIVESVVLTTEYQHGMNYRQCKICGLLWHTVREIMISSVEGR